ncbi:class I SAM-dependent methyltransferase [Rubrobacter indicoceani]|uniref:class I SAM-dependent methyltransferase n=1 Tax=Rubrobacter indicoceani TaxID=2051957 RepID=UPI0013C4E453|nr:class I SAM-dependent methyltransferase [Rubrobacter indicoceani]
MLVKPRSFVDFYRGLQNKEPKNILEVGMFEGGSLVLFDKLFSPEKLVGLDIRREPIEPLENYRRDRPHIKTFYGLSQNDPELRKTLGEEFPEGIDLVVDDASHHYEMSRATFHSCFPLVNPGGLYVIEDWSWSHQPGAQTDAHPWFKRPALTNLILDLLINVPNSPHLEKVTLHQDIVVVEKSLTPPETDIDLDEGHDRLRGHTLGSL